METEQTREHDRIGRERRGQPQPVYVGGDWKHMVWVEVGVGVVCLVCLLRLVGLEWW